MTVVCPDCDRILKNPASLRVHKHSFHRTRSMKKDVSVENPFKDDSTTREDMMINRSDQDYDETRTNIKADKHKHYFSDSNENKKKLKMEAPTDPRNTHAEVECSTQEGDSDEESSLSDLDEEPCNDEEEEDDAAITACREHCSKKVAMINAELLKKYYYLLSPKSSRRKILKSAPLAFYKSLQLLFKCVLSGVLSISEYHRAGLREQKTDIPFIRKWQRASPMSIKASVLNRGGNIVEILKILLPIVIPL